MGHYRRIDTPPRPRGIPRREFLRSLTAAGAGGLLAAALGPAQRAFGGRPRAAAAPAAPADAFPDGLIAGDPQPDGAVIWARVAPPDDGGEVVVAWLVATDAAFESVVAGGLVTVGADTGWTPKVRVRGLLPDRWYFYRFTAYGLDSRAGRLRTAPRPSATPDRLRYAFASCQQRGIIGVDGLESLYVTHRAIAQDAPDFLMHLGDYVYVSDGGTLTLDDYRGVYRRFRSNPLLQDLQAAVPLVATWDDGEFYNGVDRTGPPERLANARRAWFEAFPVENDGSDRLYRRLPWGRLADVLMLDTRQYRDPEVPQNVDFSFVGGQDSRIPPGEQMFDPARTTLGAAQRAWFETQLTASRAAWRMIGSSYNVTPWRVFDLDDHTGLLQGDPRLAQNVGVYVSNEAWDDYQSERRQLLRFLQDRDIRNNVFTCGHTHFFLASELQPDFDDANSPTVAFDFTTGSQTADPDPRELAPESLLRAAETFFKSANRPYMKGIDLLYQGFALVDVTPEECIVHFRGVDTFDPDAQAFTFARFRVANGSRVLEVLPVEEDA
jgi:alkaline phosphatase D